MDELKSVFQINSEIVQHCYQNEPNFLIEFDPKNDHQNYCAIYFSSNDIYYPNTESVFEKNIVQQNKYEWYKTRVPYACKHIFVRDIKKQWYLTGINEKIDNPDLLFEFLYKETLGYNIITIGSSAGGYASVLYGSLLNAKIVLTFNGQFELNSLLTKSNPKTDPLIFSLSNDKAFRKFYDLTNFQNKEGSIFYFYSSKSHLDIVQYEYIKNKSINVINFKTSHHGIPFLKIALPELLKKTEKDFMKYSLKKQQPLLFTLNLCGFKSTFKGLSQQTIRLIIKKLK